MVNMSLKVLVLLGCLAISCHSRPMGGLFQDTIYSLNASAVARFNGTCHVMGLYNGSFIRIAGTIDTNKTEISPKKGVGVMIGIKVYKMMCANFLDMSAASLSKPCSANDNLGYFDPSYLKLQASGFINKTLNGTNGHYVFEPRNLIRIGSDESTASPTLDSTNGNVSVTSLNATTPPATTTAATTTATTTTATTAAATTATTAAAAANKHTADGKTRRKREDEEDPPMKRSDPVVSIGNATSGNIGGMYLLQIYVERTGLLTETDTIITHVNVEMHNPHGYLSAVDYPALVFYGIMTTVYAIYGIAWIVMMLCSFSDLVRLQFWVLAVVILGFLEKTFFVAEYSAINLGNDTYGSYVIAEFVSAVKRGLSRMLLIIVAMGFGTVKPRLGDSLFKVVAAGVAYFSLALVDGIMRSRSNTFHTNDTSSVVTLALLLLLDTFIFYWIFTAIVDTRRTLRLRKNYVKLAMYNHFAYTLIFAVLATVAFTIWVFVALEYPSGLCLTDWREVWVRDCFWHVLFAFILLVVMVIWRPSSNRSRFAYSLVADEEEVVFEQGSNKNFETVKMRSVIKTEPPPTVSSQAEDDLRWVEENLPTTAMDKALPLLLDSEEEVMTTKFEVSKMN